MNDKKLNSLVLDSLFKEQEKGTLREWNIGRAPQASVAISDNKALYVIPASRCFIDIDHLDRPLSENTVHRVFGKTVNLNELSIVRTIIDRDGIKKIQFTDGQKTVIGIDKKYYDLLGPKNTYQFWGSGRLPVFVKDPATDEWVAVIMPIELTED